jgi:hypothetical protein
MKGRLRVRLSSRITLSLSLGFWFADTEAGCVQEPGGDFMDLSFQQMAHRHPEKRQHHHTQPSVAPAGLPARAKKEDWETLNKQLRANGFAAVPVLGTGATCDRMHCLVSALRACWTALSTGAPSDFMWPELSFMLTRLATCGLSFRVFHVHTLHTCT